jgi:hypothetical protein
MINFVVIFNQSKQANQQPKAIKLQKAITKLQNNNQIT